MFNFKVKILIIRLLQHHNITILQYYKIGTIRVLLNNNQDGTQKYWNGVKKKLRENALSQLICGEV